MFGILAATGASFAWTLACFIWRSNTNFFKPLDINFIKNLLAFLFFIPFVISFTYEIQNKFIFILFLSGIIGIGFGDTFYLTSLKLIGTRKTLSIEALSPLLAAFAGDFFINESLQLRAWIGIAIVTLSLTFIIREQNHLINENSIFIKKKLSVKDYMYAFLSVFCAVLAGLLSRYIFLEIEISPLITTEIRLLGAIIFLLIISKFKFNFFIMNLKMNQKIIFIISVLLGTNLGILLQQIVFKTLPFGIGWTLLSTSPVISLLFAKKEEGHITKEIILSTFLLFGGLTLIIL